MPPPLLASHPTISVHLTDPSLTPILSSTTSGGQPLSSSAASGTHSPRSRRRNASRQLSALNALQATSLTTYTTSARLSLGLPQRVMISTSNNGPVLLHSYLSPDETPKRTRRKDHAKDLDGIRDGAREGLHNIGGSEITNIPAVGPVDPESMSTDENTVRNGSILPSGKGKGPDQTREEENRDDEESEDDITEEVAETEETEETEETANAAQKPMPLLIATVVAPSETEAVDARKMIGRMERIGVEWQREYVKLDKARTEVERGMNWMMGAE